jgi:hypothetical protein
MQELRLGDQVIRYDREATVAAYKAIPSGDADRCGCLSCRNFAAQRSTVYPPAFRMFLDQIGIDPNKEGEIYDKVGPFDNRIRPTGGWFYFVGELIEKGERLAQVEDFQYWCQPSFPQPHAFLGDPIAAIEFSVQVPWVLQEKPY